MTAARRTRLALAALAATAVSTTLALAGASPGQGAPLSPPYPAPVMTGYVPLDADATRQTLANASANAGTVLDFTVGITNAGVGAVMYYDHWEDGYEADLTNPVQSTTLVWGDGNPANGDASTYCGPRCAGDLLPAGAVFALRNLVPTPRNATAILWDGRDRISSTRGFAITAGGFTTSLGSVLSASASAYDTTKWGTDYWVPVGQDMVPPPGTSHAFSTTNLQVMADQPGTVVEIDRDGDGVVDITQTIGAGEVVFVSGGVNRGAHVRSSKPVQAHVGAGDTTASYEMRWFTLSPTSLLSADYLNPVGSRLGGAVDNQRTITYLFNPNDTAITVVPTCTGCSGTIAVPARSGAKFASPLDRAVRFENPAGEPFVAVGAVGSESGAAPGTSPDGSQNFDWGFGLVPTRLLTPKAVLGWAPGNSLNPPSSAPVGNYDDDPVWISALRATTIYIDYDGDPTTGALSNGCQGNYDETRTVGALESVRVFDAHDGDMTGASIYTCDNTLIAGAWGQDPQNAPTGSPGFDAGYALIPSTTMVVNKTSGMALDANGDGRFGPGDRIAYEISIADAGSVPFINVKAVDALPDGTSYVPGSTTITNGAGPATPFADDVTPPAATAYPLDEGGAAMPTIQSGTTLTIRYQVEIDNPFPAGTAISNSVTVIGTEDEGGEVGGGNADVIELVAADLSLTKQVTSGPTYVGDSATFLVTVHNDGPDAAPDVVVRDLLPAELSLLSTTPSAGDYDPDTGLWSVGTIPEGRSETLSVTATVNAPTATNRAEVAFSGAADPDSTPGNGVPGEDDQAEATVTALPGATVGDRVFLDLDGDGVQGPGEPGLAGVQVILTRDVDGDGTYETEVATATSSDAGSYWFEHLPPGSYRVEAVAPSGSAATTPAHVDVVLVDGDLVDTADFGFSPPFDLRLAKRADGVATVGSDLRWIITVTNAGSMATGPDVVVTDVLPAGLEYTSAGAAGWSCTATAGTVVCTHPEPIAAGQVVELVVTTRVTGSGQITNRASVSAPGVEVSTDDNAASAAVEVVPPSPPASPQDPSPTTAATVPVPASLPATGGDVRGIVVLASITLLAGLVLVRRRRTAA